MIKIRYRLEDLTLTVSGHARSAPAGQDLVCCAVSTLAQCLLHDLETVHTDDLVGLEADVKPGDLMIRAVPHDYARIGIRVVFATYITALWYVAEQNGDYVEMEAMTDGGKA